MGHHSRLINWPPILLLNACHSAVEGQNGDPGNDLHPVALAGLEKAKTPTKTISEDMIDILMINNEEDRFCLGKKSMKKGTSS
jgi:hypothetical protein